MKEPVSLTLTLQGSGQTVSFRRTAASLDALIALWPALVQAARQEPIADPTDRGGAEIEEP